MAIAGPRGFPWRSNVRGLLVACSRAGRESAGLRDQPAGCFPLTRTATRKKPDAVDAAARANILRTDKASTGRCDGSGHQLIADATDIALAAAPTPGNRDDVTQAPP